MKICRICKQEIKGKFLEDIDRSLGPIYACLNCVKIKNIFKEALKEYYEERR